VADGSFRRVGIASRECAHDGFVLDRVGVVALANGVGGGVGDVAPEHGRERRPELAESADQVGAATGGEDERMELPVQLAVAPHLPSRARSCRTVSTKRLNLSDETFTHGCWFSGSHPQKGSKGTKKESPVLAFFFCAFRAFLQLTYF